MENYENIEIDIGDVEFLILAKAAHKQDITFNQLINKLLRDYIEKQKNDSNT